MASSASFGESFLWEGSGFQGSFIISPTGALYFPDAEKPGQKNKKMSSNFRSQEHSQGTPQADPGNKDVNIIYYLSSIWEYKMSKAFLVRCVITCERAALFSSCKLIPKPEQHRVPTDKWCGLADWEVQSALLTPAATGLTSLYHLTPRLVRGCCKISNPQIMSDLHSCFEVSPSLKCLFTAWHVLLSGLWRMNSQRKEAIRLVQIFCSSSLSKCVWSCVWEHAGDVRCSSVLCWADAGL